MTYRKLNKILGKATKEQLNQDVTVFIDGEFYPLDKLVIMNDTDVLDKGHLVLTSPGELINKPRAQ